MEITDGGDLLLDTVTASQFSVKATGTARLSGQINTSGGTTVAGGRLLVGDVAGSSASIIGALMVDSGAMLGGYGTVGSTTIASGGIIAPGNSIGTLTVSGDLTLAAGSVYQADIAGNGTSDRIAVSGNATIGGSHVEITALDAETSYQNGQAYTILTAGSGVSGQFADAVTQSAFLDLSLDHQANAVDLIIKLKDTGPGPEPEEPKPLFTTVADTRNQLATAGALDTLAQTGPSLALYNKLLVLNADQARAAFDGLSGEIHASAKTALIEDSRFVRDAASDRVRSAFDGVAAVSVPVMAYDNGGPVLAAATADRFAVWGQGFGSWGHNDNDGNAARLDHDTGGFLAGADMEMFDTWRLGVLAGYSRSSFDADDRRSSGTSDNYHLGLYGGTQWGNLGFRSGLAYSWHRIETGRSAVFDGFADHLNADYRAGTFQAFGELGYRIDTPALSLEPFANLAYVSLRSDGFTEKGGIAALSVNSETTNTTFTTLGLRAAASVILGSVDTTVRGTIGWKHAFNDTTPLSSNAFATGGVFTVAGAPIARDSALIEAGLDMAITPAATLGLAYNGQIASDARQHGFKANLGVRF
ncbi:MAG: autotransporter outer membrane beta-barrel domain-containing protein [Phyllobacterium sp.]